MSHVVLLSRHVHAVKRKDHLKMEGVCAPAARACHADNVPTLPVETPRTLGLLKRQTPLRASAATAGVA